MIPLSSPNRANKRKNKRGGGCAMCKPWKHGWADRFKKREKDRRERL